MAKYITVLLAVVLTACGVSLKPVLTTTPTATSAIPTALVTPSAHPVPTLAPLCVSAEVALHIRAGGGINHHVTGYLRHGDRVDVLAVAPGWVKTAGGWVSVAYLEGCYP
jgi:uncharacterized protein YgiM (DUF1202 family)